MNQRIQELIVSLEPDAFMTYKGYLYHSSALCFARDHEPLYTRQELEKFAELLIRDCAKFLDENSGSDCTNNVWYPEPEELLNHFGVESE